MSPKQPKPMTGAQLDAALIELFGDNRQTAFALIIGAQSRTVRKWCGGELPVPRHIAMLVNAMLDYSIKPKELRP